MQNIFVNISKYILLFLMIFYTLNGFSALKINASKTKTMILYYLQNIWVLFIIAISNLVLFINTNDQNYAFFMAYEILITIGIHVIYKLLYERYNKALLNHQCMLLALGLIMLSRLDSQRAMKQLYIAVFSIILTAIIPFLIKKFDIWNKLTYVYITLGIVGLLVVLVGGHREYGAKISLTFAGTSIQPSEFVKILFVLGLSCALYKAKDLFDYALLSFLSIVHIVILLLSRDLGGASILFVIYILMFFLATHSYLFLIPNVLFMAGGLYVAEKHLTHVQNRILAWKDPLSHVSGAGYQVSQSLFAIGSGGWFGSGLYKGMPNKIPVVSKDFIFAAFSEEFGSFFAICLILTYTSCFILIMNLSLQKKDKFQSLVAAGFGLSFGFQVFLSIGGVIKFIPSTGVTMPFISAGGSSLMSSFIMFAIIQGMGMKKKARMYLENE